MSADPVDWILVKRITRLVRSAPGGGLHRTALADLAGVSPFGDGFKQAVLVAYQYGRVDFCRQYVVAPARKAVKQK